MTCDRATAEQRLTYRWKEQRQFFPNTCPLDQYIRRNVRTVMRDDLLREYDLSNLTRANIKIRMAHGETHFDAILAELRCVPLDFFL